MNRIPLAERMRPKTLKEVVGQEEIIGDEKILTRIVKNSEPVNMIFWGPPGTGKTTLARILATEFKADFIEISAVTSGKKDVEKVISHAKQNWNLKIRTVLFVDEIHRFNKAQQDAFLPHVESGLITLIGATTENPSFEIISPLLSRSRILVLEPLSEEHLKKIINNALKKESPQTKITAKALEYLVKLSAGDARHALGNLELALSIEKTRLTPDIIKTAAQRQIPGYDKKGDVHYDTISAFIKSMRGSDVEATLYYLERMLQAGEDPKFIARRMIIFASEDIGLAGNGALGLAVSAFQAIERIGLPEGEYTLYHVATALAKAKKSRQITHYMQQTKPVAKEYANAKIPLHIRNAPTKLMKDLKYGENYKWEDGYQHPKGFLPTEIAHFKLKDG